MDSDPAQLINCSFMPNLAVTSAKADLDTKRCIGLYFLEHCKRLEAAYERKAARLEKVLSV